MRKALVLFSGGQDSTTCLAWALDHFDHVETVAFSYGQRHEVELRQRQIILTKRFPTDFPEWSSKLGADHWVEISSLSKLNETALTGDAGFVMTKDNLPNTFIPGRNLLFLTYAAAICYARNITDIVAGMCQTDYSGYPDCRAHTIAAMEAALNYGMDRTFNIHTPVMHIDKAATWQLARDLGGDKLVEMIIDFSHTCYKGDREVKHVWGYGCGDCPACHIRAAGWHRWKATPPTAA